MSVLGIDFGSFQSILTPPSSTNVSRSSSVNTGKQNGLPDEAHEAVTGAQLPSANAFKCTAAGIRGSLDDHGIPYPRYKDQQYQSPNLPSHGHSYRRRSKSGACAAGRLAQLSNFCLGINFLAGTSCYVAFHKLTATGPVRQGRRGSKTLPSARDVIGTSFAEQDDPSSSSADSAAEYASSSEASEDDDGWYEAHPSVTIPTQKKVEKLVRKAKWAIHQSSFTQSVGQKMQASSGDETPSSGHCSIRGDSASRKGNGRPTLEESQPHDDEQDGQPKKRRKVKPVPESDLPASPRFACVFFKHDPERYKSRRTCAGPGWATVHRMKEHLYRAHAQPIYCPRCYKLFDADTELSVHLRSEPCEISTSQSIEGINREQLSKLRKRTTHCRLEEDKWRDTYHILFPEVLEEDIPSPFYDGDSPAEQSRQFRRELLALIRTELLATAEREPRYVEERLLRQVAGIVQRCQNQLLAERNINTPTSTFVLRQPQSQAESTVTTSPPEISTTTSAIAPQADEAEILAIMPNVSPIRSAPSIASGSPHLSVQMSRENEQVESGGPRSLTNPLDTVGHELSEIDWNTVFDPAPEEFPLFWPPEAQTISV
ncbi:hypothetical protein BDY21DRAFT_113513 [Lineolata rhizophorae]|uniref:C2H2-type domain-containing protein n=1 Tax=Lineolata rhizophorae TaxID=578093 RepID=A0A6A6NRH0_9PEZI|nr:hypothetical protein BDY21DRAFT_113513 [Lineolata rhizophorae]